MTALAPVRGGQSFVGFQVGSGDREDDDSMSQSKYRVLHIILLVCTVPAAMAQAVQPEPNPNQTSGASGLNIQSAIYASPRNGHSFDVTNQVKSSCRASSGSCLLSCGNQLAGDPDFGTPKYCRIVYVCPGAQVQKVQIQEGGRLTLSCPVHAGTEAARQSETRAADREAAASFDCKTAATTPERKICGNPELSKLDSRLGEAYSFALDVVPNPKTLRQEQRAWLSRRDECMTGRSPCDPFVVYRSRITELTHTTRNACQAAATSLNQADHLAEGQPPGAAARELHGASSARSMIEGSWDPAPAIYDDVWMTISSSTFSWEACNAVRYTIIGDHSGHGPGGINGNLSKAKWREITIELHPNRLQKRKCAERIIDFSIPSEMLAHADVTICNSRAAFLCAKHSEDTDYCSWAGFGNVDK